MNRFRVILAALSLWAPLLALGSCRSAPDYRENGEAGEAPAIEDEPTYTETYSATLPIYRPVVCNHWHNITISAAQEGVDCETYDYRALYGHAISSLEFRAKQIDCEKAPQPCPNRQTWVNYEEWNCAGERAAVNVGASVRCTEDPGEQQWDAPTPEELRTAGSKIHDQTARNYGESLELTPMVQPKTCPTEAYYRVVLKEKVEFCKAVTSMKPHVDEARARVKRLWDLARCPTPCRKEDFRPEKDERYKWTCGEDPDGPDDLVTVIAEARVRCVQ